VARRYRRRSSKIIRVGIVGLLLVIGWFASLPVSYQVFVVFAALSVAYLCYRNKRAKEEKLLRSGISEVDHLSGEDFEKVLAMCFEREGYRVKVTPEFGDFGADLVMSKDGVITVVQAKRWNTGVGIEAVQQIVAAKAYYQALDTMVVTNSDYSPAAIELAKVNGVTLWGRRELIELLHKVNGATLLAGANTNESPLFSSCPECGKTLVERITYLGSFYGCSGYPLCRFTLKRNA